MTEWITTREAADILGLKNTNAVTQAAAKGRIKARKLGNGVVEVTRYSVQRYAKTRRRTDGVKSFEGRIANILAP